MGENGTFYSGVIKLGLVVGIIISVIYIMNIQLKNNHYILDFSYDSSMTNLLYLYTPDYFEELGFFTSIILPPTNTPLQEGIQQGGDYDQPIETISVPFRYFVAIVRTVSKGLPTFNTESIRSFFQKKFVPPKVEEPSVEPSVEPVAEQVEEPAVEPAVEPVPLEEVAINNLRIELTPFDTEDRLLKEPISFRSFIKERIAAKDDRIHNEIGLTYNECLKWLDMLKIQRIHRENKQIRMNYNEDDLYVLDGRLIVLGTTIEKESEKADIITMESKERELLHFVSLEGTERIEDLHH